MRGSLSDNSPRLIGRCAGAFYLIVVVATIYSTALAAGTGLGHAAGMLSAVAYVVVSALFYHLFKPAGAILALLAAFLNLVVRSDEANPSNFNGGRGFVRFRRTLPSPL